MAQFFEHFVGLRGRVAEEIKEQVLSVEQLLGLNQSCLNASLREQLFTAFYRLQFEAVEAFDQQAVLVVDRAEHAATRLRWVARLL